MTGVFPPSSGGCRGLPVSIHIIFMSQTGWATYQSAQSGGPPIDLPLLPSLADNWTMGIWGAGVHSRTEGLLFATSNRCFSVCTKSSKHREHFTVYWQECKDFFDCIVCLLLKDSNLVSQERIWVVINTNNRDMKYNMDHVMFHKFQESRTEFINHAD